MERYIDALKRVPGCHLSIIDLAWKIVKEDGDLEDNPMLHNLEVEVAAREARAHVNDTRRAIVSLCQLARLNLSPPVF